MKAHFVPSTKFILNFSFASFDYFKLEQSGTVNIISLMFLCFYMENVIGLAALCDMQTESFSFFFLCLQNRKQKIEFLYFALETAFKWPRFSSIPKYTVQMYD